MQRSHVAYFVELARSGDRIVNQTLPGKAAKSAAQAAEFEKPCGSESADNIAATTHADHQSVRRSAQDILE